MWGRQSDTRVRSSKKISGPEISIWESFLPKKMIIELGDIIKGESQVRGEKAQVLLEELQL